MPKFFIVIIVFLLCSSCAQNTVFSEYKSIPDATWHKDNWIDFSFNALDTITKKNIYLNLRNNKDYDFNNIFLIISVQSPDNTKVLDTLEYQMTDERGYYLGEGFTDIKENKLEFKTNTIFPNKGNYRFQVQHGMRKNGKEHGIQELRGITDVGISIEKVN